MAAQLFDVLDTINTFHLLKSDGSVWTASFNFPVSSSRLIFCNDTQRALQPSFCLYGVFGYVSILLMKDERSKVWKGWHWTPNYRLVAVFSIFGKQSTVLCGTPIVLLGCGCHEHHVGGVWHGGDLWRKGWRMACTPSPAGRCCHLKHIPAAFAMLPVIVWCSFRQASISLLLF